MKPILITGCFLMLSSMCLAQSPALIFPPKSYFFKSNPGIPFQKGDTTLLRSIGKNIDVHSKGGIKILPLDNMPCLATTINSNLPIASGLSLGNYKPVPIPNGLPLLPSQGLQN